MLFAARRILWFWKRQHPREDDRDACLWKFFSERPEMTWFKIAEVLSDQLKSTRARRMFHEARDWTFNGVH